MPKLTSEDFEPIRESVVEKPPEGLEDTLPPKMEDIEWENYVLSFFEPQELDRGLPKVKGIRRIARLLLGPIVYSKPDSIDPPNLANGQRCTIGYTVRIKKVKNLSEGEEYGDIIEFGGAADAWPNNITGDEFKKYPTANADTRAEGRALRRALNLNTVAAEEISDVPPEESGLTGLITESQINKLDAKCEQLNINVTNLLKWGKYKKVEDIPYRKVVDMFKALSNYQRREDDDGNPLTIPEKILGYDPNWRQ